MNEVVRGAPIVVMPTAQSSTAAKRGRPATQRRAEQPKASATRADDSSPNDATSSATNSATKPGPSPEDGDASALRSAQTPQFEAVYAEHHDFVWKNVQRLGTPASAADDATQEVFVVVARRLDDFEGRSSLRTWLFAIMVRVVRTLKRTDFRRERCRRELAWSHPDDAPSPTAAEFRRSEAVDTLHQLLSRIDDAKRAVFVMSELEGMTGPEIARALDLGLPAVYTRLRSAKRQLAQLAEQMSEQLAERFAEAPNPAEQQNARLSEG